MSPNEMPDVCIIVVGNGYRVNPVNYRMSSDTFTAKESERVFETFDAMVKYLRTIIKVYPKTDKER